MMNECKHCAIPDSNTPPPPDDQTPMCHACWCQHTEAGRTWWKDEQMRLWNEEMGNRAIEEDYYRRQPHESPDQYLSE